MIDTAYHRTIDWIEVSWPCSLFYTGSKAKLTNRKSSAVSFPASQHCQIKEKDHLLHWSYIWIGFLSGNHAFKRIIFWRILSFLISKFKQFYFLHTAKYLLQLYIHFLFDLHTTFFNQVQIWPLFLPWNFSRMFLGSSLPLLTTSFKYAKFIPKNVIFDKGTSRYTYYYQVPPLGVKIISQK